jgi:hypothetical protein
MKFTVADLLDQLSNTEPLPLQDREKALTLGSEEERQQLRIGLDARIEHRMQLHRHFGIFGRIPCGLLDIDLLKADLGCALAGHLFIGDGASLKVALRQRIHAEDHLLETLCPGSDAGHASDGDHIGGRQRVGGESQPTRSDRRADRLPRHHLDRVTMAAERLGEPLHMPPTSLTEQRDQHWHHPLWLSANERATISGASVPNRCRRPVSTLANSTTAGANSAGSSA